ncbi:hypothetical protein HLH34_04825 [Gluconacetobacter azotocaptans]|uniref:Uncharacterized protein n=1 Tax=Gluconacetobacter azotocaptans TaxID=142834 RepID=A0A7W4JQY2_9PROT|nr:hypothetical protein [Gluconacetobacter azotocaptans]MBB2189287.1 hypothetical protein [Gluconacetobacter azotocaptans]MBM9402090.1 hypothetical protein [Gluconacetobacter azotocaptans]GBQ32499.1 hypothetical protein AA13594_2400 [Gluconacetobacter azotocaptans DSM 13594]
MDNHASRIVVDLLRPDDIAVVYPLVRSAFPAMDRRLWMRSARRATRPGPRLRRGMLVARHGGGGFPCGLISFHCDSDMRFGRVLTAEHFIVLTFGDHGAVLDAFLPALDALARQARCGAVRTMLPATEPALLAGLAARGHREAGAVTVRLVADPPAGPS